MAEKKASPYSLYYACKDCLLGNLKVCVLTEKGYVSQTQDQFPQEIASRNWAIMGLPCVWNEGSMEVIIVVDRWICWWNFDKQKITRILQISEQHKIVWINNLYVWFRDTLSGAICLAPVPPNAADSSPCPPAPVELDPIPYSYPYPIRQVITDPSNERILFLAGVYTPVQIDHQNRAFVDIPAELSHTESLLLVEPWEDDFPVKRTTCVEPKRLLIKPSDPTPAAYPSQRNVLLLTWDGLRWGNVVELSWQGTDPKYKAAPPSIPMMAQTIRLNQHLMSGRSHDGRKLFLYDTCNLGLAAYDTGPSTLGFEPLPTAPLNIHPSGCHKCGKSSLQDPRRCKHCGYAYCSDACYILSAPPYHCFFERINTLNGIEGIY